MEIGGIPLHPLVVHAVVVFAPVAALFALANAAMPRWQPALRWPLVVCALIALVTAFVAVATGEDLAETRGLDALPKVDTHADAGEFLRTALVPFALVALLPLVSSLRRGSGALLVRVALVVAALVVLYAAVRAGHTGAVAVWS